MLKKNITYTSLLTDESVTEMHYFHLSKADLIEMEVSQKGGMQQYIQRVIASEDGKEIIAVFKDLIRRSYGQRTDDGRFFKNPEKTEEFMSSEAYSELFMSLVTDAEASAEFVNGIIPAGLNQDMTNIVAQQSADISDADDAKATADRANAEHAAKTDPTGLSESTTPRVLTRAELIEMPSDELRDGLAHGRYRLA